LYRIVFHINTDGAFLLAQSGIADQPLWRGVLALLLTIVALAITVAASGYAQRWMLAQFSRRQLVAQVIFSIATFGGALLWLAAKSLRMVELPAGGITGFRPFTQGLAKCGVIMIGVTTVSMLMITWRDRTARFGISDAKRAVIRIGLPGLFTFIIGLMLLEPLLMNTNSPRPTNDDITMRSPLGLIIGATVLMFIAAAGAWRGGVPRIDDGDSPVSHRRSFGANWKLAGILLPVCFVLFRIAVKLDPLAPPASKWLGELGGSSDQSHVALWVRWCIFYAIAVIACQQAAMRGMNLAIASTEPQKPIAWILPTTDEMLNWLPWRQWGGRKSAASSASASTRDRTSSLAPMTTGLILESVQSAPPLKRPLPSPVSEVRTPPLSTSPPDHSSKTKRDIAPDRTPSKALPLAAKSAPRARPTDEKSGEWTPLPIDPRTGLIRKDAAERIRRELEQDTNLVPQPHRRRLHHTEQLSDHTPDAQPIEPASKEPQTPDSTQYAQQIQTSAQTANPTDERLNHTEPIIAESTLIDSMPHYIVQRCRWVMLFALLAYAALSYYASMVPLNYQPITWNVAVERFRNIPRFDVHDNANRRADFVANIVLFFPIGFLAMGTFVFARRSLAVHLISVVVASGLCVALAYGIEFRQLWYPPRTVSQNDLTAAHIGAVIGIVVWLLLGRGLVNKTSQLFSDAGTAIARLRLLQLYAISLIVFCLLPMDFTLSLTKVISKLRTVQLGGSAFNGDLHALGRLLRDVVIFIPIGMFVFFRRGHSHEADDRPKDLQHVRLAGICLFVVSASIECLKLFMVNDVVDLINIPTRTLGGIIGAAIAAAAFDRDGSLRLTMNWSRATRIGLAVPLVIIHTLVMLALLAPPWRLTFDSDVFHQQLIHFKTGLFVNYYYSGEWTALTNLTHYVLLFIPLGIVLHWSIHRGLVPRLSTGKLRQGRNPFVLIFPLLLGLVIGGAIELLQTGTARKVVHITADHVKQQPVTFNHQAVDITDASLSKGQSIETGPMPDSTDLLAYTLGTITGWLLIGQFLPVIRRN